MLLAPMLPPLSGVATSQSTVVNNQVQLGDVFATQTLNVVDTSDLSSAVTSATGNGLTASVDTGSLDVQSTQTASPNLPAEPGNITAETHFNATGNIGAQSIVVTAATANTNESNSLGGGALTGSLTQIANGAAVTSDNDFNASTSHAGNLSISSQAIVNSISVGITGGSADLTTNQSSSSDVLAKSGSDSSIGGATLKYTPGTATFTSIAVVNNVTSTGTGGATQTLDLTQSSTGDSTHGYQYVNVSNGQTVQGETAVTGNNISISNESAALNVVDNQMNTSFTQAESGVAANEYGSAQSTASGVGNSILAANVGPHTQVSNTQNNGGEIDVTAGFTGGTGPGYDAAISATAMANAATAFACSDCGGVININNSQSNDNGVNAFATVDTVGANRSVSSVATAVGNNATFYVSKPR